MHQEDQLSRERAKYYLGCNDHTLNDLLLQAADPKACSRVSIVNGECPPRSIARVSAAAMHQPIVHDNSLSGLQLDIYRRLPRAEALNTLSGESVTSAAENTEAMASRNDLH